MSYTRHSTSVSEALNEMMYGEYFLQGQAQSNAWSRVETVDVGQFFWCLLGVSATASSVGSLLTQIACHLLERACPFHIA